MTKRVPLRGSLVAAAALLIGVSSVTIGPTSSSPALVRVAAATGTLGTLKMTPGFGTATDFFNLTTVSLASRANKGCPTGATNVTGKITGPGQWTVAKDINAFPNTSTTAGVSTTDDFDVPMGNSMAVIATNNSISIVTGQYDIIMTCQNALGTSKFGTFAGSIWFTALNAWTATDPSASSTTTPPATTTTPPTTTTTPPTTTTTPPTTTTTPPTTTTTPPTTTTAPATTTTAPATTTTAPTTAPTGTATTTTLTIFKGDFDGTQLIVREGRDLSGRITVTPTTVAGTVQLFDLVSGKTTALGDPRPVRSGARRFRVPALSQGTHVLTAVFTPATGSGYAQSMSKSIVVSVVARQCGRHHGEDDHSLAWRIRGAD